ncbi:MAG: 2-oxoacid:acceptor oxidoreductase subunit alpha [Bacteroidetes bacterium]|nr:2-oxoacid:acceptor oxidoreductase subunit alpha [Bacteroidota bacterium]
MEKEVQVLEDVTIRFAGDSGDGMQLTGTQFTNVSAMMGNDLATLPDFPAEIRAPIGTLYGVSGFQVHIGSGKIHTPGDHSDVLVAMNPAALKVNLRELDTNGIIIANEDQFTEKNLKYAGYEVSPLEDNSLIKYRVFKIRITHLTGLALEDLKLPTKTVDRCKNFFALGLIFWLFSRDSEPTIAWIKDKFKKTPELVEANIRALKAGYNYGVITEAFQSKYEISSAQLPKGKYRNITGNTAMAIGLVTAAQKAGLELFLGSYPITPASDILHDLSKLKNFGVKTFQAEDEIAAIASAIGASFAGDLGMTTTSGPGVSLKGEAIGYAVMTELPLVIVNIQRGGPSTGLPTKTEQSDLNQAIYGRHGEAPLPVIAPATPSDCFIMAFEACRLAIKYMTPVIILSDGYLANGSEPWKIPSPSDFPEIKVEFLTEKNGKLPYSRNEFNARPWIKPGTPNLEHRIGGIEKANISGNISYDPENHHNMVYLRKAKIENIANDIVPAELFGNETGDVLVVGWGSTYGAIRKAVELQQSAGKKVSHLHLRHLYPMAKNVESLLKGFKKVLVPEMNTGQLAGLLRSDFLVPTIQLNKVYGQPFKASEITKKIDEVLRG